MATYIFFWNPEISSLKKDRFIEEAFNYADFTDWSIREYEEVKPGDRFYMIVCGQLHAVIAKGDIISEASEGRDWSGRGRRPIYYVDLDTHTLVNPFDTDTLLTADELTKYLPDFNWYGGAAGQRIDDKTAAKLDELFDKYVKANSHLIKKGKMWTVD